MILAHRGFRVSVFETQSRVGGRNASIKQQGYTFDVGPTFLMLKEILDEVFLEAGTNIEQVLDSRPLDPMYRLQFAGMGMDVSSDRERMKAEIGRCFPGREAAYDQFMDREKARFEKLDHPKMYEGLAAALIVALTLVGGSALTFGLRAVHFRAKAVLINDGSASIVSLESLQRRIHTEVAPRLEMKWSNEK